MHYTDFLEQWEHLLRNLGWPPEEVALSHPQRRTLSRLGFDVRSVHLLTSPGGRMVFVRLAAHQLPDPASIVAAFVETSWEARGLLRWCHIDLEAEVAVLMDPAVLWVHRLASRDHCISCVDGQSVEDRLLPLFAGDGDPIATMRGWNRESSEARGRGLKQWLQLWERRLGEACAMPTADARRLIQQLLLVRKCRGLTGLGLRRPLRRAVERALEFLEIEEIGEAMGQALRAVDMLGIEHGVAECLRGPTERHRTDEALARSELTVGALLRSLELLSEGHLTARVWLAAEAEAELQRISWRLCVEDPDPMSRHGTTASPHDAPPLRLDVLQVGYEYPLLAVESALRWITRFNASLRAEYATATRQSFQPDFLTLADGDADPTGEITDPLHFALRHLVEITAPLPAQNTLLKWLMTLRMLELAEELEIEFDRLPALEEHF
jgi:hypothetical protein